MFPLAIPAFLGCNCLWSTLKSPLHGRKDRGSDCILLQTDAVSLEPFVFSLLHAFDTFVKNEVATALPVYFQVPCFISLAPVEIIILNKATQLRKIKSWTSFKCQGVRVVKVQKNTRKRDPEIIKWDAKESGKEHKDTWMWKQEDAGKTVGVGWLEGAEKGEESTKTQLCSKIL